MAAKKAKGAVAAICSDGKWPACSVHPNFGRCDVFNFVKITGKKAKLLESLENPFANGPGAGISSASLVAEKGATHVIAGQFGPNAAEALSKWGIKLVQAEGRAEKALAKVKG